MGKVNPSPNFRYFTNRCKLKNTKNMNMNNEIILRSAYGKVNQMYFIQPCPNPRTGRYPDCVRLVRGDANKGTTEMVLSEDDITRISNGEAHYIAADHTFEIVDGTHFDLDDVVDKAN